jgi:acid phosphatase
MFDVRPLWTIIFSFVAAIASVLYYSHGSLLICPRNQLFISQSPYHPSWDAWTHPSTSSGSKDSHRDWNLFYHLGGYGPWVKKLDGHAEPQSINPPEGCAVNQVHMV